RALRRSRGPPVLPSHVRHGAGSLSRTRDTIGRGRPPHPRRRGLHGGMSTQPDPTVVLGDRPLTVDEVVAVARHHAPVTISEAAWGRVRHSRAIIDALAEDTVAHYGVSTGFG